MKRLFRFFKGDRLMKGGEAFSNLHIQLLYEVGRSIITSTEDITQNLKVICETVTQVLRVERVLLLLKDDEENYTTSAWAGNIDESIAEGVKISHGKVRSLESLRKGEVLILDEDNRDRFEEEGLLTLYSSGFHRFMMAPMMIDGELNGILLTDSPISRSSFGETDIKLISVLSNIASIVKKNSDLISNLKEKTERLSALLNIGRALSSTLNIDHLFALINEKSTELLRATHGAIMLVGEDGETLYIKAHKGIRKDLLKGIQLKKGVGISGWVAETGKSIVVSDVNKDGRYISGNPDVRSELAVPMILDGKVIGVIDVESVKYRAFTEEDRQLLEIFASYAVIAYRNARLFSRVDLNQT